jgi:sugar/nucleoside kinase (ribokinase family)
MDVKTAYEPVSVEKSTRFFDLKSQNELKQIKLFDLATPNETELRAMHGVVQESMDDTLYNWSAAIRGHFSSENLQKRLDYEVEDRNSDLPYLALELLPYIPSIVTKLGPRGVLLTLALYEGDPRLSSQQAQPYCFLKEFLKNSAGNSPLAKICGVYVRFLPPTENVLKEDIISVNGAGDTLLGVVMAGLAKSNPKPMDELVEVAQRAAVMTLKHEASVSPKIQSLMPLL